MAVAIKGPSITTSTKAISNLTDSFFVVVQVKIAGKSGKVTSQKTQVSTSKKLTFFE